MAKKLGSLGGMQRGRVLSAQQRQSIAALGAKARVLSLKITKSIQQNFHYVEAMNQLKKPAAVVSSSQCPEKLPGLYVC